MLVFIDESGDSGLKLSSGSSRYFVIALVTFSDNEDADLCDKRIDLLRQEIGKPAAFEFHFSKNSKHIRESFLDAMAQHPFSYHIVAVDKTAAKMQGHSFDTGQDLYNYAARLAFENATPHLSEAKVVIDRRGDRTFRDGLSAYLRRHIKGVGSTPLIASVKVQHSNANNLLQLADYVVGVSNRFIDGKPDGLEYRRRFLATHELTLQVWPK